MVGVRRDVIWICPPVVLLLHVHDVLRLCEIGLADQAFTNHFEPDDLVGSTTYFRAVTLAAITF